MEQHLAELKATLDALKTEFEAVKGKDLHAEVSSIRAQLIETTVAEVRDGWGRFLSG
jgi:hypothetical protein